MDVRTSEGAVVDVMAQTSGDDSRGWIPVPGHSACLRAVRAREAQATWRRADAAVAPSTPPDAVALPVLQRPGEALGRIMQALQNASAGPASSSEIGKKTSGSIP